MKKIFIFLFLFSLFSDIFAISFNQDINIKLDNYLNEIVQAYKIPGLAFVLTDSDNTIFSNTYGQFENENQQIFIGSESKSFTALSIMQLEEKGLINLDDDFTNYLSEYNFDKKVSIRNLLNQTSGFDNHAKLINFKMTESYGSYEYANVNYDLLGKIIEVVSGLSYDDYISENIFIPLGMTHSVANTKKAKNSPYLLKGNRNWFGFFVQGDADYPTERSWFFEPAGYIASSLSDYSKYLRMYLKKGLSQNNERIIKEENINRMWFESVNVYKESNQRYGMGFFSDIFMDNEVVYHPGQVENSITYMMIFPKKKIAFSFMINASDEFGTNQLVQTALKDIYLIISGNDFGKVSHSLFFIRHLLLNLLYILIISIGAFVLFKSIKIKKRNLIFQIIFCIFGYLIYPLFLLYCSQLFFLTPLWTVKLFVPDLFFVIVTSIILCCCGVILRIINFFYISYKNRRRNK